MARLRKYILFLLAVLLFSFSCFFISSYFSLRTAYYNLLKQQMDFHQKKYEIVKQLTDLEKKLDSMRQKLDRYESLKKNPTTDVEKGIRRQSMMLLGPVNFLQKVHGSVKNCGKEAELLTSRLSYLLANSSFCHVPSIWPVGGWISSMFGMRNHPLYRRKLFHRGIDITNSVNSPVFATACGKVVYVGDKGGLGKTVVIDHGSGVQTQYSHLNKIFVKTGLPIAKGDRIALVGNSGLSTGPHLHYEIQIAGRSQDPLKFIF